MEAFDLPDELRDETRAAWHRYLDLLVPFRPDLHRYCRSLTGEPWDAEDLVQETLLRGFGTLGSVHQTIRNPRGYLIRIASNLWIDMLRSRGSEGAALTAVHRETPELDRAEPDAGDVRKAGERLMQRLSPQQRAAVVLKDVFEMSLEETAELLGTTIGSVKAALHRGRARLRDPAAGAPRSTGPSQAIVDRFVHLLNDADLSGLLALMSDTGSVEMLPSLVETGLDQFERKGSWFWHAVHVHPELPAEIRPEKFVNERGHFQGEAVMLSFSLGTGRKLLEAVARLEERDGRITRVRAYNFCPETVREVGDALGLEVGAIPYRPPTPKPGRYWAKPESAAPEGEAS